MKNLVSAKQKPLNKMDYEYEVKFSNYSIIL